MSADIQKTYEIVPESGKPQSLVILLHGLGSNGRDLISLAPQWSPSLPHTAFVSPDAPFVCDMVPSGYGDSYQWFSLQSRDPLDMQRGADIAAPILIRFIKAQAERFGLPLEKVALVGFSQGTMMSLFVAPRVEEKLAGVLGYSGALLGAEDLLKAAHRPPVHLIHGEHDDVVPVQAYHMARAALEDSGFEVSGHTTPFLPHSIDAQGIASGGDFLRRILA